MALISLCCMAFSLVCCMFPAPLLKLYVLVLKKRIKFDHWLYFSQEFVVGCVVESVCGSYFSQQEPGLSPLFFSVLHTNSVSVSLYYCLAISRKTSIFFHLLILQQPQTQDGCRTAIQSFMNELKVLLWKLFRVKSKTVFFPRRRKKMFSALTDGNVSVLALLFRKTLYTSGD